MARANWIDKGLYHHPQVAGCMSLKQYMIVDEGGARCLLLRFFNESGRDINAMEFKLVQLDMSGEVIDSSHIKLVDIKAHAGNTYAIKRGIVLSDHCVDFRVTVLWVMSGGYKYVLRHNQMIPEYDVRGVSNEKRPHQSAKSHVRRIGCPGRGLAAFFSFAIILGAAALFVYYSLRSFGNLGALGDIGRLLF